MNKSKVTAFTAILAGISLQAVGQDGHPNHGVPIKHLVGDDIILSERFNQQTKQFEIQVQDAENAVAISIYKDGILVVMDEVTSVDDWKRFDLTRYGNGSYEVYASEGTDIYYVTTVTIE